MAQNPNLKCGFLCWRRRDIYFVRKFFVAFVDGITKTVCFLFSHSYPLCTCRCVALFVFFFFFFSYFSNERCVIDWDNGDLLFFFLRNFIEIMIHICFVRGVQLWNQTNRCPCLISTIGICLTVETRMEILFKTLTTDGFQSMRLTFFVLFCLFRLFVTF